MNLELSLDNYMHYGDITVLLLYKCSASISLHFILSLLFNSVTLDYNIHDIK